MDAIKIKALKDLGIDEETIQKLLADVQQTEKAAEADGVRYKGARQGQELQVAKVLTSAMETIEDRIWHEYEQGNFRRAIDMTSGLVARTKAATDPAPDLQAALAAAIEVAGEDAVIMALKQIAADGSQGTATKAARRDMFAAALMGDLRADGRPR